MKSYKQYITEMAERGGRSFSMFQIHGEKRQQELFNASKDFPSSTSEIGEHLKMHVGKADDGAEWHVLNDHSNQKSLYMMRLIKHPASTQIPHSHIEQTVVDRVKSDEILPKEFATNYLYSTWDKQAMPLRSSDVQYDLGNSMWSRLVDKAFDNNKHVYYVDEHGAKSVVTPESKDSAFSKFYGDPLIDKQPYKQRHLLISHTEL